LSRRASRQVDDQEAFWGLFHTIIKSHEAENPMVQFEDDLAAEDVITETRH